ncbi:MAG: FAD binding domain-containing protein [Acidimicrobiia bacterium]
MKPAPFEYHAPATLDDAVGLLGELGDAAKVLAGGQSLIPMLALRLAFFEHLVDLGRIEQLQRIERVDGSLRIGAGVRQSAVERSTEAAAAVPLLARATPLIGHVQIRNRGTVGGSIAHADPAAEYPAVALTLDAVMEVASPRGAREVPAAEFFAGTWTTDLADDEVLTALRLPVWDGRCGFAVEELARRHGDFAIAGATIALELAADDTVRRCAIGLFGVGPVPERGAAAERAAVGTSVGDIDPSALGEHAAAGLASVPDDAHGPAGYRRHVAGVMVARGWRRAVEEAARG